MASAAPANSYMLLQYKYVPDILEKRGPFREQHLAGANKMAEQQKLMVAGAVADPVDGAVFIFRNVSKEEVDAFVASDPYFQNGLIPSYSVRPYMVVAGDSS
ncbi:YCII-related [Micractinium conductrix]|uniref:YCII-related n=1 Tax=Micractinium conductrix TaxID=554055 RepID=A0A2P6V9Q0_9CHLO|nr:YCII-related [Micractinium conductrix]|eukprot:PSC70823.1 YCII-related [Micractinium conductrix]